MPFKMLLEYFLPRRSKQTTDREHKRRIFEPDTGPIPAHDSHMCLLTPHTLLFLNELPLIKQKV